MVLHLASRHGSKGGHALRGRFGLRFRRGLCSTSEPDLLCAIVTPADGTFALVASLFGGADLNTRYVYGAVLLAAALPKPWVLRITAQWATLDHPLVKNFLVS